jgi:hypothetical protein
MSTVRTKRPRKPPQPEYTVPPECIPDVTDIVIDDGAPVDGMLTEKQMRLLTEPLYSSWPGPGKGRPFAVLANVGLFHTYRKPPIVPDVMLSLDVEWPQDLSQKEHQTYFLWVIGKLPEVAIEVVSNREGREDAFKKSEYARIGIRYYVIYDPENLLSQDVLRLYVLHGLSYQPLKNGWLADIGLGLRLWQGTFEKIQGSWLRWCDRDKHVIVTGAEGRELERQRATIERKRRKKATKEVKRLRQRLRDAGLEPGK